MKIGLGLRLNPALRSRANAALWLGPWPEIIVVQGLRVEPGLKSMDRFTLLLHLFKRSMFLNSFIIKCKIVSKVKVKVCNINMVCLVVVPYLWLR